MALFSRRPKKGVVRKGRFNDTIPVYTAPSGTQYVLPSDVLRPTPLQFDKLLDNVYKKMKRERGERPTLRPSAPHHTHPARRVELPASVDTGTLGGFTEYSSASFSLRQAMRLF